MEGPVAAGCPGCFLPSGRDVGPVGTLGGGRGFRAHAGLSCAGHTARGGWGPRGVRPLGGLSLPGRTVSLLEEGPHPPGFSGRRFCSSGTEQGSGQLWMRLREGAWPHGLMAQDKGPSRTWQGGKGSTEGGEGAGALGGWAAPGGAQGCLPEEEVWSEGLEDANAGAWRSEGTARRRVQGTGCGRGPWGHREDSSEKGHRGPNQRG